MTVTNSARNIQLVNAANQVEQITKSVADIAADQDPLGIQVLNGAITTLANSVDALKSAMPTQPAAPQA